MNIPGTVNDIMTSPLLHNIERCVRCNGPHADVSFFRFEQPVRFTDETMFTHWGSCPATVDPILLAFLWDGLIAIYG